MDSAQYAELFLTESREHVSAINHSLLALERGEGGTEPVGAIFRSVANLSGEITTQYVLRYHTDTGEAPSAKVFRKIKVAVDLPNITLRYRQGYYPNGVPQ